MKKIFPLLFVLLNNFIFGQLSSSMSEKVFQQLTIPNKDSVSFYLSNKFRSGLILKAKNFTDHFTCSDSILNIGSKDSILVKIFFVPKQNIEISDIMIFESTDSNFAASVKLRGSAIYGDSYDATTFNKFDTDLKTALNALVINHISLGYNLARDRMFENIDKLPGDTLECVYTGRKIKALTRTEAQNLNFNTEHSWPQSFFSENEPMKSDLNHLFITDNTANSNRANLPFGIVTYVQWEQGGSKLGTNKNGALVYEPRNIHKGNVSRGLLYFVIRYPQNYGGYLGLDQEQNFRIWNKSDPVDLKEKTRNNLVASYQNKRNPFIDHPEFIDRIFSFITTNVSPKVPQLSLAAHKIYFDSVKVYDTLQLSFCILNAGNNSLNISNVSSDNSAFEIKSFPNQINVKSFDTLFIRFIPKNIISYNGNLSISTNGGNVTVPLIGFGKDASSSVNEDAVNITDYKLFQNYPNPFNPTTKIEYGVSSKKYVVLNIYDVLGREIETLINEEQPAGKYSIEFDGTKYSSGIYYYELRAGDFRAIKKMLYIK